MGEQASRLRLPEVRRPPAEGGGIAEAPTAVVEDDARLQRLAALREKGVLTDEEFAAEKARVLGGTGA